MTIADCIEANLRKLQAQNITVATGPKRISDRIEKLNELISRVEIEVDGQDFDPKQVNKLANPFSQAKKPLQCLGSEEKLVWRTFDGSLALELSK